MSVRSSWELRHDLVTMSAGQLLVRGVVVLAGVLFAVLLGVAGDPGTVAVTGIVLAAVGAATAPQSGWATVALVGYVLSWVVAADPGSALVLPAALSLLVLHTGCALVAVAPPQADLPPGWARLHGRRLAVVVALTVACAALVLPTASTELPGGAVASLLALGVLAAGLLVHDRSVRRSGT